MAKTKNKKTFASRAKEIQKKYEGLNDKLSQESMERELQMLMQEQEAVRESMGLNNDQQEFACGGKMKKYANGSFMDTQTLLGLYNPSTMQGLTRQSLLSEATDPNLTFNTPRTNYDNIADDILPITANLEANIPAAPEKGPGFFERNKRYLPSAISGLTNIGGNLLLASMAKKGQGKGITPSQVSTERINLEPRAEQLRRDATIARNIAMRNARNLGTGTGVTLANIGAASAGISRGLGANLANLYGQQEQFNVGAANQAAMANQAAANRAALYNAQLEQQGLQDRLGYYGAALQEPSLTLRDLRQQLRDERQMGMWDRYMSQPKGHYRLNTETGQIEYYG